MNAVSIISVCFGGISLLVSLVLFIRTIARESKKDWESQNQTKDEMKASLLELSLMTKNINNTTNDIKADVKSLGNSVKDMDSRLVKVEIEQKTLWDKIGEMKEAING